LFIVLVSPYAGVLTLNRQKNCTIKTHNETYDSCCIGVLELLERNIRYIVSCCRCWRNVHILTDKGDQIMRLRSQTLRQHWRNFGLGQFEMSAPYIACM